MTTAKSIIALACLLVSTASADIVIEFKHQGNESQFLTNGKMARINTRDSDDYMLVDFEKNSIYSVSSEQNQVVNLSDTLPSIGFSEPPKIEPTLKPLGEGPAIVGYPTTQYRFSANGEHCGSIFASKDALNGTAIEEMLDTLKAMADSHMQSLGGFAALIPVCQLAKIELANKFKEIGAPMRMTNSDGEIDSEISKILKKASVETDYYELPARHQLAATDQEIKKADKQRKADNTQIYPSERHRGVSTIPPHSRVPPGSMMPMWRYREMMRYR